MVMERLEQRLPQARLTYLAMGFHKIVPWALFMYVWRMAANAGIYRFAMMMGDGFRFGN
jgi:hypothetical protein